jgi:hypothetical protein
VEGSCEHGNKPLGSKKMLGNSLVAAQLVAAQDGLRSVGFRLANSGLPI